MPRHANTLLKAVLSALHYSGADGLIAPFTAGNGVIFMLHHVRPEAPRPFEPNGILKITPDFLEKVIRQVSDLGFEFVAMDDVPERLRSPKTDRPFAAFTLDDGYRDNRDYALPIFKKYGVPFTIYVPADFGDGRGDLWWLTLEEALRRLDSVSLEMDGSFRTFALGNDGEKNAAFETVYWWLRSLPESQARAIAHDLARQARFDPYAFGRELVMTWDELRAFASDPLVTVGAHTLTHHALAKLPASEAEKEINQSIARIEAELGRPCRHFSYPYGCEQSAGRREFEMAARAGVATAVTTRKGLLHASHAEELSALPRLSLNGDFQDARYVKVLLSGVPFALWNAVSRIKPRKAASAAMPLAAM